MPTMTPGEKLKELRESKGLEVQHVANATGSTRGAIESWEQVDKLKVPNLGLIERLADLLGPEVYEIFLPPDDPRVNTAQEKAELAERQKARKGRDEAEFNLARKKLFDKMQELCSKYPIQEFKHLSSTFLMERAVEVLVIVDKRVDSAREHFDKCQALNTEELKRIYAEHEEQLNEKEARIDMLFKALARAEGGS